MGKRGRKKEFDSAMMLKLRADQHDGLRAFAAEQRLPITNVVRLAVDNFLRDANTYRKEQAQ